MLSIGLGSHFGSLFMKNLLWETYFEKISKIRSNMQASIPFLPAYCFIVSKARYFLHGSIGLDCHVHIRTNFTIHTVFTYSQPSLTSVRSTGYSCTELYYINLL